MPRDGEASEPETLTFSQHLACPIDGESFDELAPRNFSFNSPYGACPRCDGLGTRFEVDPELVVPDPDLTIAEGAIRPWAGGHATYFHRMLEAVGDEHGIPLDVPWTNAQGGPAEDAAVRQRASARSRSGTRTATAAPAPTSAAYEGVIPWLQRRHTDAESDSQREQFEGYMREVPCPACDGARLNPFTWRSRSAGATSPSCRRCRSARPPAVARRRSS